MVSILGKQKEIARGCVRHDKRRSVCWCHTILQGHSWKDGCENWCLMWSFYSKTLIFWWKYTPYPNRNGTCISGLVSELDCNVSSDHRIFLRSNEKKVTIFNLLCNQPCCVQLLSCNSVEWDCCVELDCRFVAIPKANFAAGQTAI